MLVYGIDVVIGSENNGKTCIPCLSLPRKPFSDQLLNHVKTGTDELPHVLRKCCKLPDQVQAWYNV